MERRRGQVGWSPAATVELLDEAPHPLVPEAQWMYPEQKQRQSEYSNREVTDSQRVH